MGTGGTLSGIARYLKEQITEEDRDIMTVGVDAEKSNISAVFHGEEIGEYDTMVEGLGKGSELPTMWFEYIDDVVSVSDDRAFNQARNAARDNGLLIGPSAGSALAVSRDIVDNNLNATVVTIVCDGGEQYFDALLSLN
jgi:cysteine synthase